MPPPRLSAVDASFLYLERPRTPMHVGAVAVFATPAGGVDYERLVETVERRLATVPRYRQRVRRVPGDLARPVWVDDGDFDIAFHVRRSALPHPGTSAQLTELVARLMSRPLDPDRPLWEMYVVEGLADDRFAVITKTHQAMVDGVTTIDIGQVLLDTTPDPAQPPEELWMPRPEPTDAQLVAQAVADTVARPAELVDTVRHATGDLTAVAARLARGAGALLGTVAAGGRLAPGSPLNVAASTQRRFAVARGDLDAYRAVRDAHDCTVNDVVLAVVAGALRTWLLSRGEPVTAGSRVRALVPLWVRAGLGTGTEGAVSAGVVDLPVGEPSARLRLQHVAHAMREHTGGHRSVRAGALARLGGHAPPTLHALGARAVSSISRRIFNLVVTNVPGPQVPLYAAGARMLEMFPVVPLAAGQGLAIGITSYDGGVHYGLNGDRDALADIDVLAQALDESLDELRTTSAAGGLPSEKPPS
ncbi:MAG: diacylglycerol O-acyltransferase / wax synthase, partial [Pseudonocardiales bacterium]|nr:diacylglycerol O-acyltransferase / wax synthase [Pseudonocardiales bacterium]